MSQFRLMGLSINPKFVIISLFLTLSFSNTALAQNSLREELQTSQKKWGVSTSLLTMASLHDTTDPNHSSQSRLSISPKYNINKELKLSATFSGTQQLNSGRKSSLSNTRISLQHSPFKINQDIIWFPTVFTDLATDVEGRKRNTYRGNAGLQATGVISTRVWEHNYSIIPAARIVRNFHRLTRNADDSANIQQSALASLAIETELMKNLSFSVGGSYNYGWTYQTSTRETYSMSQELAYQVDKVLSVAIGHSNDAGIFAANGHETNIRVFDGNTSAVYLSLSGVY